MNFRYVAAGAVFLAIAILGGLWLFLRQEAASAPLSAFEQSCVEGQRRAVTGQPLPLDDESEARILAYCGCVAEEVAKRLGGEELAALGLGQPNTETSAKLDQVIAYCRDRAR